MSRALIALCALLQAVPARYTVQAASLRACRPVQPQRRSVELWSGGRQLAVGTWLVDGRRSHIAVRNTLGQPVSILRIADGAVGLELVGRREIVAADASLVVDVEAITTLALGWLPREACELRPMGEGWSARGPEISAVLDREAAVIRAQVGPVAIERAGLEVWLRARGAEIRLVLGEPEELDVPAQAFRIGLEHSIPTVSAERLGRLMGRRLLGL